MSSAPIVVKNFLDVDYVKDLVRKKYPNCQVQMVDSCSFVYDDLKINNLSGIVFTGKFIYVGFVSVGQFRTFVDQSFNPFHYNKSSCVSPIFLCDGDSFQPDFGSLVPVIFDNVVADLNSIFSISFNGFRAYVEGLIPNFVGLSFLNTKLNFDFAMYEFGQGYLFRMGMGNNSGLNGSFFSVYRVSDVSLLSSHNLTNGVAVDFFEPLGYRDLGYLYYNSIVPFDYVSPSTPVRPVINSYLADATGFSFTLHQVSAFTCQFPLSGYIFSIAGSGSGDTVCSVTWDTFFGGSSRPAGWDFSLQLDCNITAGDLQIGFGPTALHYNLATLPIGGVKFLNH